MKSATLPAPYKGENDLIPKAALTHPECENLINFNVSQDGITLRHGDSIYQRIGDVDILVNLHAAKYNDSEPYLVIYNADSGDLEVYNLTSGSLVYSKSIAFVATDTYNSIIFNKYLMILNDGTTAPGIYYDGSTWGALGYSGTGLAPVGGAVYKNRAYLVQSADASYWYSGIDLISGACTKVDLNSVISEAGFLISIHPITISDSVATVVLLAFVFNTGEVLFYEGSYPNSTDWGLVGGATIGHPLNYKCTIPLQGDGLVMTDNGLYSLRDLFLKGSEGAEKLSVNSRIQKKWTALVQGYKTYNSLDAQDLVIYATGVWDRKNDRIIVSLPGYFDSSGDFTPASATCFIFDNIIEAWFRHISYGPYAQIGVANNVYIEQIISFNNLVLMVCGAQDDGGLANYKIAVYEKEGATGFTDEYTYSSSQKTFDFEMLTAPIPFLKTAVYETTQIEPIIESDLYATTNWYFISDFGKQTTDAQILSDPALPTTISKPAVNTGIGNITYVQVKMSGTTAADKTVGLTLYSYNVWYNSGAEGSR